MSTHLVKIVLMVAMTHGFRALGRISNPRWAGLILGLPCTTAVALVGGGSDRGVDHALAMSGASLIGLAAAVALPVAYTRAILFKLRLPWAILAGVGSYLVVALTVSRLLPGGGEARLGIALMAVLAAVFAVGRMPADEGTGEEPMRSLARPISWTRAVRTIVPVGCLLASLGLGESFGPEVGGLMSTFPGVTLSVLWLTHLESGPASALRMARALPSGNLGMVAFLATFRFACPGLGLAGGTVAGYIAALAMLALVVSFDCLRDRTFRVWRRLRDSCRAEDADRPAWPRASRRFSPWVEPCAW